MTITYSWADPDNTSLRFEDDATQPSTVKFIPTDPRNRDYAAFLASGATAADYVAPEPPAPLTPAEKLEAAGLTVDELKQLLELPTGSVSE